MIVLTIVLSIGCIDIIVYGFTKFIVCLCKNSNRLLKKSKTTKTIARDYLTVVEDHQRPQTHQANQFN